MFVLQYLFIYVCLSITASVVERFYNFIVFKGLVHCSIVVVLLSLVHNTVITMKYLMDIEKTLNYLRMTSDFSDKT